MSRKNTGSLKREGKGIKTKRVQKKDSEKRLGFIDILAMVQESEPWFLPVTILQQLIASCLPFLAIILGARVIEGISEKRNEQELIREALFLVAAYMVLSLIRWALDKILIVMRRRINDLVELRIINKALTMDYQVLEKAETMEHITKAREGSISSGGISNYCSVLGYLLESAISIVYSLVLVSGFFFSISEGNGSGISSFINSIWFILLMLLAIAATVWYSARLSRKCSELEYAFFEGNVKSNREFSYFSRYYADYQPGKVVRIYDMKKYILEKMGKSMGVLKKGNLYLNRRVEILDAQVVLVYVLFMLISYVFVGLKAVTGAVSLGQMTMYVGAFTTFTQALINMYRNYCNVIIQGRYLFHYAEFLAARNEKYDGTLPTEKRLDNDYELEFRDVSFHYPNSSENVLEHVTAKIHVGKKMAIVGRNGAGKSTFIKLLCRLYDPTEGEILLNGIDIKKYDYDEYRDIFGVVFQDFQLFSFSIGQNVAAGVEYDRDRVIECLKQAGLGKRVEGMKRGLDSVIYHQGDEGVEISGGEAQKLAIARALYKNAPVVILDEPTAALDPVAELEVYQRFDEMVNEKTAIYISHRMSSCRFCENILVFDKGKIIQMGSHEKLVQEEGMYREMWEAQSQYYQ